MTTPRDLKFGEAAERHIPALARLAQGSFPRAPRDHDAWAEILKGLHDVEPDPIWTAYENGRPVAFCLLHGMRQWIRGAALPVCGVGLVSVSLAARRQGVARMLVESGIRHARRRGDVASALFPFRGAFYERLGYGWAGEADQIEVSPDALPWRGTPVARVVAPSAMDGVRECYARWIRGENGQMERPWPIGWDSVRRDGATVVAVGEDPVRGYAVVVTEGETLDVREMVWESAETRESLLSWLGSVGDQYRKVRVRAHPRERIVDRLTEVRTEVGGNVPQAAGWELWFPAAVRHRGPMFRLLDPAGAIGACVWPEDGRFGLRLHDPVLAENRGEWTVELEAGRAGVEAGPARGVPVVDTSIVTASRLFAGDLTPAEAVEAGLAAIPEEALAELDSIFRTRRPWTFQRF